MTTRGRQRTLRSTTTRLPTERGSLFVTVSVDEDEDGRPVEVFGSLGKAGSPEQGTVETACRLISLHLRHRTPVAEIVRPVPRDHGHAALAQRHPGRGHGLHKGRRRRHRPRAGGAGDGGPQGPGPGGGAHGRVMRARAVSQSRAERPGVNWTLRHRSAGRALLPSRVRMSRI